MLTRIARAFLRFGGFMPTVPVAPRPAPAKRPANRPGRVVPAKDSAPAPAPPAPEYKAIRRRPTFGLATACRHYAEALSGGFWDVAGERYRADIAYVMGPGLTAWQRALRLAGQSPWRWHGAVSDDVGRANAKREMVEKLEVWERALVALDRLNVAEAAMGRPPLPPLQIPAEVAAVLEARRKAALERAQQRARRGASEGGSTPVPVPTEDVAASLGPR